MVLAEAGLSQTRPALWRIVGVWELAQLNREEVLVQRSWRAAAGADEVVRGPLPQFCLIRYPGPKLGRVRAGAEQAAITCSACHTFFPFLPNRAAIAPMLFMAAWLLPFGDRLPRSVALQLTARGRLRMLHRRPAGPRAGAVTDTTSPVARGLAGRALS